MSKSKFIYVVILQEIEGTPGVVKDQEIGININVKHITIFNETEDPKVTFIRLSCGAPLYAVISRKEFIAKISEVADVEQPPKKKVEKVEKVKKAKKATSKKKAKKGKK